MYVNEIEHSECHSAPSNDCSQKAGDGGQYRSAPVVQTPAGDDCRRVCASILKTVGEAEEESNYDSCGYRNCLGAGLNHLDSDSSGWYFKATG